MGSLLQPFSWSWSRRLNARSTSTYSLTPPTQEDALSQGTLQETLLWQALLLIGGRVTLSLPRLSKQRAPQKQSLTRLPIKLNHNFHAKAVLLGYLQYDYRGVNAIYLVLHTNYALRL